MLSSPEMQVGTRVSVGSGLAASADRSLFLKRRCFRPPVLNIQARDFSSNCHKLRRVRLYASADDAAEEGSRYHVICAFKVKSRFEKHVVGRLTGYQKDIFRPLTSSFCIPLPFMLCSRGNILFVRSF